MAKSSLTGTEIQHCIALRITTNIFDCGTKWLNPTDCYLIFCWHTLIGLVRKPELCKHYSVYIFSSYVGGRPPICVWVNSKVTDSMWHGINPAKLCLTLMTAVSLKGKHIQPHMMNNGLLLSEESMIVMYTICLKHNGAAAVFSMHFILNIFQ